MNYSTPSEILVRILKGNGFHETTVTYWRDHWERLQTSPYDPHTMKRTFKYKQAHRLWLYFEYTNLKIAVDGEYYDFEIQQPDDVKALIAFFQLYRSDRQRIFPAFRSYGLPGLVELARREIKRHTTTSEIRFKENFHQVVLPVSLSGEKI